MKIIASFVLFALSAGPLLAVDAEWTTKIAESQMEPIGAIMAIEAKAEALLAKEIQKIALLPEPLSDICEAAESRIESLLREHAGLCADFAERNTSFRIDGKPVSQRPVDFQRSIRKAGKMTAIIIREDSHRFYLTSTPAP